MYNPGAYAQISITAHKVYSTLPTKGILRQNLSKIRGRQDEPLQEFVDRLLKVAGRNFYDSNAGLLLVNQLTYENANQAATQPHRKNGDISEYINLCTDIGPSYTQGLPVAAVLQGKTIKFHFTNKLPTSVFVLN